MLALVVTMAGILSLSLAIVAYVAYPHRGRDLPQATWLSEAMRKGVSRLPVLDEDEQQVLRRQEQAFLGRR